MRLFHILCRVGAASLLFITSLPVHGAEQPATSTNVTERSVVTVLKSPPGGIGLLIGQSADKIYVRQVVKGTPAWNAAVREGDVITAIGSQPTVGMRLRDIAMRLRGEVGSQVEVTLARAFPERTFKVTLKREVVKPPHEGFRL